MTEKLVKCDNCLKIIKHEDYWMASVKPKQFLLYKNSIQVQNTHDFCSLDCAKNTFLIWEGEAK